ncbi:hypothetical protein V491_05009 [Pseudogymnoascus sp. VKM F-3775]|nr:hypothetical protein V491_05009 [Pseudogymnoascus sp. VKM F-3775]
MKCQEPLTGDASRKSTATPRRKPCRISKFSSLQKPMPPKQKSQIPRRPTMSPSQPFQSILGALRLTRNEHDLFTMLLAPLQEPQGWLTEEDKEGKDWEMYKFENDEDCDASSSPRIESFNTKEDQSESAVGILQEIVDVERAWISWNSLPS